MYKSVKISDKIYYAGANDRRTHLFENMWPLDHGVSYNTYLIKDEKVALMDTIEISKVDGFIHRLQETLEGRSLDYLVIQHMEPDHAGSIRVIRNLFPDVTLVGNKKTLGMLEGYFGVTDNVMEVKEGDILDLGHHKLQFFMAPMVHWPEVMVTYDQTEKILFSADAFGCFGTLDGGVLDHQINMEKFWPEMRRYYSNIVGKYGSPVQKALQKLAKVEIKTICSLHGPVWQKHVNEVIGFYDQYSRFEAEEGVVVAYASMYGNTEEMAEAVAQGLVENGISNVTIFDVSKTHLSHILSEIFKYKGLILGSPTYCNEMHPNMENLVLKLEHLGLKNRLFGAFGSFTWAGAAAKKLQAFGEKLKLDVVGEMVEEKQALKEEKYQACLKLGREMAHRLIEERK